ncbi:tRNA (N6-isopentenyl adenosine(37)-C2)-methylthiotransferase MiaB, partial [Arthrobacter sp. HMWF013]
MSLTIPSPASGTVPSSDSAVPQPRTYQVRTFGCQMNVHDSERMAGMLEDAGYVPADGEQADVVVFNTCAVRENADNKLYGNLGML